MQAQTATVCRSPNAETVNMVRYMTQLVTASNATDSESVATRTAYKIPVVATTQISVVQTERTCKSALQTYSAALLPTTVKPTRVFVVAVGNVYVVWTPISGSTPEWTLHMVLDSKFVILAKFAG